MDRITIDMLINANDDISIASYDTKSTRNSIPMLTPELSTYDKISPQSLQVKDLLNPSITVQDYTKSAPDTSNLTVPNTIAESEKLNCSPQSLGALSLSDTEDNFTTISGTKRKRALSYVRTISSQIPMPSQDFTDWYALRKPHFFMERGMRLMHPEYISVEWLPAKYRWSRPGTMSTPFKLSFNDVITDSKRLDFTLSNKVAMVATYRCNGTSQNCVFTDKRLGSSQGTKKVCTMTLEVKVFYSDLSKCVVFVKNAHTMPEHLQF
jgi:hypothetical protein